MRALPRIAALMVLLLIVVILLIVLFHRVVTPPSHVTVLVDQPLLFGHGGVRKEVQTTGTGWYWWTTKAIHVPIYPFKQDEKFDDLSTRRQSFIDFSSYLKLRIVDPQKMVDKFNYPNKWYDDAIKEQYRTVVRNEAKKHLMEDILTNPDTLVQMEAQIRNELGQEIKRIGLPVVLEDLSLGRASPNGAVMSEIDNTAAQQQRIKTEQARELAEKSRESAEIARAKADNAYRQNMGLNTAEFVQLSAIRAYSDACKEKGATCVISNGNTPVMVAK